MTAEILVLRLVHILSGIFWLGSALFTTFFLAPAVATLGPAGGALMAALRQRRLMTYLPLAALLTILSGLRLMWITSSGFSAHYVASAGGRTYIVAGIAAIIGFLVGMFLARPSAMKMGRLGASIAQVPEDRKAAIAAELEILRRRNTLWSSVALVLIVLSAAGMAVARYLS